MTRSNDTIRNARIRTTVLGAGLAVAVASAGALAAPFVPVRRDARLELTTSSATPAFVSAELVLPRATTSELAAYARTAGGRAAATWLCDAYTDAPPADPDAASLKQLVAVSAATDETGIAAADALVCPRIRRHLFALRTKHRIFCLFHCTVTYPYRSPVLAYRGCEATDEDRAAFDAATCTKVLLGHSGRASALRFFAKRAATAHACLSIRLSGGQKPAVALGMVDAECE